MTQQRILDRMGWYTVIDVGCHFVCQHVSLVIGHVMIILCVEPFKAHVADICDLFLKLSEQFNINRLSPLFLEFISFRDNDSC